MNIKALITTLVLGSSSVAMARPVTVSGSVGASWTYGTAGTVSAPATVLVRDHRAPAPAPVRAPAPALDAQLHASHRGGSGPFVPVWATLGTMNQIADGEMSFAVSPSAGKFIALKLQNTAGKSLINRVKITFANGRTQTVELNQYLMAGKPAITIDLEGEAARSIRNVTVVGRNARMSAYSVLAI